MCLRAICLRVIFTYFCELSIHIFVLFFHWVLRVPSVLRVLIYILGILAFDLGHMLQIFYSSLLVAFYHLVFAMQFLKIMSNLLIFPFIASGFFNCS